MEKSELKNSTDELYAALAEALNDAGTKAERLSLLDFVDGYVRIHHEVSRLPLRLRLTYYRLCFIVFDHLRRRRQLSRREQPMDWTEVGSVYLVIDRLRAKIYRP